MTARFDHASDAAKATARSLAAPAVADTGAVPGVMPSGAALLVLVRVAAHGGATRAEIVRDLASFVSHRLSPAEWRAAAAEGAARLIAAGLVSESRGRLTLTDRGAAAARTALHLRGALDDSWPVLRDERLVARALGIEGASAARVKALASPEGLRATILQTAFGLPLKGNQTANRLRVALAVVALERAFGNKIKGGLGASGGFNAKAGRLLAGQLSSRPRDFGTDGRLVAELAAEQVGAAQTDADSLRLALIRRWASSLLAAERPVAPPRAEAATHPCPQREPARKEAPPPVADNDREPAPRAAIVALRPDLEQFAAEAKVAATGVAEGWPGNRKAFISRVWPAIRAAWPSWQLTEIEFKCMLAEAHRAGQLVLATADLKDKRSIADVEASAVAYKNTVWHYVRVDD